MRLRELASYPSTKKPALQLEKASGRKENRKNKHDNKNKLQGKGSPKKDLNQNQNPTKLPV